MCKLTSRRAVKFIADYKKIGEKYAEKTGEGNEAATLFADLKIFGNAVTILKGDENASNFKPIKLDEKGFIATIDCSK